MFGEDAFGIDAFGIDLQGTNFRSVLLAVRALSGMDVSLWKILVEK